MKRILYLTVLVVALVAAGATQAATATPGQVGLTLKNYLNTQGIYSSSISPYKAGSVSCDPGPARQLLTCHLTIIYANGAPGSRTVIWHAMIDRFGHLHYKAG